MARGTRGIFVCDYAICLIPRRPRPAPATQLTREAEPDSIGMGKMERVLCATRDCERDVESPPPPSLPLGHPVSLVQLWD